MNFGQSCSLESPKGQCSNSALPSRSLGLFECTLAQICVGRFQIVSVAFSTALEAVCPEVLDATFARLSGFSQLLRQ